MLHAACRKHVRLEPEQEAEMALHSVSGSQPANGYK